MVRLFNKLVRKQNAAGLGRLEAQVMDILWSHGENSVREVGEKLSQQLAYTTVMTTLDRLHKKGLLSRSKRDRAFYYSPSVSRLEWERRRAAQLVSGFFGGREPSREMLVSCLLDAVVREDAALLDELEKRIRVRRQELRREKTS